MMYFELISFQLLKNKSPLWQVVGVVVDYTLFKKPTTQVKRVCIQGRLLCITSMDTWIVPLVIMKY